MLADCLCHFFAFGISYESFELFLRVLCHHLAVDKLAYVEPLHGKYFAQVGDVVVGVVQKIGGNCWYIDIGSSMRVQLSILQVNTEELANRRKLEEDVYEMRNIFDIGDVISCEVQRVSQNGTVLLQTRTSKYGRLSNGILVKVKPNLMLRQSRHMHDLPFGASLILGCNGFIWLSPSDERNDTTVKAQMYYDICTLRRIILYLAGLGIQISYTIMCDIFDFFKRHCPSDSTLSKEYAAQLVELYLSENSK
ncbi:Exosome complex exonuclease RRP4 [Babesia bigemina]|uniref:Exosome complex exonuclease RRP4 n=1 Tax=Babesia bigemina TaxID=5866 RepID=A0A061CZJ9_BABBI|nr:Exosome complex exonuclease RRP4 [Babesia bigemina]CDR93813.1 Exosome complex exonuclease RRP4 [Babesia bigemina]|eukprot:XP_012765999.1 Exosome complex exonuclease RRP4 [Babesia bigemina]